ncbi:ABC transporter permease [Gallaecimonas mangrovi]|uniref:ABC transporter permease n=1 Tax=Gallaecimonas mangrovi TaxID=2291597 RepID=UPI000E1FC411|nr:FtsX-like permease family protein [Gallaecimonas mangrovi]
MFEFGPILRTLWRNKTSALLIMLQMALTLAIVVNAAFVINQRQSAVNRPTGIDDQNLFGVSVIPTHAGLKNYGDVQRDLDAIKQLPGVIDASITNSVPLSGSGNTSTIRAGNNPSGVGEVDANVFSTDPSAIHTMGLKLLDGRNFTDSDMVVTTSLSSAVPQVVIVTRQLADIVFGKGVNPVGKLINFGTSKVQVIGVMSANLGTFVHSDITGNVALVPLFNRDYSLRYMVRAKPGQLDAMMKKVPQLLNQLDSQRVITGVRSFKTLKSNAYRSDNATITMLSTTIVLISLVTGLGIVGLTLLWVNQRRKQIGTRRALGATKTAIIRYFMVENGLVTALGIVVGIFLTLAANHLMVQHYQMKALAPSYLVIGVIMVWLLGMLAALVPAWRAAQISPALATRSV